jgi:hypothetical protein
MKPMSERDEVLDIIRIAIERPPIVRSTAEEVRLMLRALFADKPWLANELLPEGYRVWETRTVKDTKPWGDVHYAIKPAAPSGPEPGMKEEPTT